MLLLGRLILGVTLAVPSQRQRPAVLDPDSSPSTADAPSGAGPGSGPGAGAAAVPPAVKAAVQQAAIPSPQLPPFTLEVEWRVPVGCDFSGFFVEVALGFVPHLAERLPTWLIHEGCPDSCEPPQPHASPKFCFPGLPLFEHRLWVCGPGAPNHHFAREES